MSEKPCIVTVRVTDELYAKIVKLANTERRTIANVSRLLLEQGLFHRNGIDARGKGG